MTAAAAKPPSPGAIAHLKPTDASGLAWVTGACILSAAGFYLASHADWRLWLLGQLILATAFLQWFVILHECGHRTLFQTRWLNAVAGHVAGFFAIIPFESWRRVHERHHKWTGWQDLDPTTAALVPRPLSLFERIIINGCWRCWIPLFAVLYRLTNFWNPVRLLRMFPFQRTGWRVLANVVLLGGSYILIARLTGPWLFLRTIGPALVLAFIGGEILLLSQHTHVPMKLSDGRRVDPFAPVAQQPFTRSLRLPKWASFFLLHFDAHELHHMYPFVPGYRLLQIPFFPDNEVVWWRWIPAARAVPGEVFFFQNRDTSGFNV